MKKRMIWFAAILAALVFLPAAASAAETEDGIQAMLEEESEKLQDGLNGEALQILDGFTMEDAGTWQQGLGQVAGYIQKHLKSYLSAALKGGAVLVVIGLLSQLTASLCTDRKASYIVSAVCVLAVTAASLPGVSDFAGLSAGALDDMDVFSKALLPTLTAAAASGGAVTSAAAKYAVTALFMDVLLTAARTFVMPLIYAYIAASMAAAVLDHQGLEAAVRLLKWMVVTALTILVLAFTIYLSVTGVISASADAAATKLTKTALSAALPVVGGILSDAAGAVVSGISILKGSVGAFGLIGVAAVAAVPCVRLLLHFLVYKAASAAAGAASDGRTARMIGAVSNAYAMMLGTVGTAALLLFVSIISLLKVVSGV